MNRDTWQNTVAQCRCERTTQSVLPTAVDLQDDDASIDTWNLFEVHTHLTEGFQETVS